MVSALALGAVTVVMLPSPEDASSSAEPLAEGGGGTLYWRSPGVVPGVQALDLGLGIEDWRGSMAEPVPRSGSNMVESPASLVDPGDPAVVKVAKHVSALTAGMPDWKRVQAALNLVQTSVAYAYDSDTYGTEDFWARPAETLFLQRGDCEDTSVLFCSIVLAMGLDAVLMDFPGHMAVGVSVPEAPDAAKGSCFEHGGRTYWYCETASDDPQKVGSEEVPGSFDVREPVEPGLREAFVSALLRYRSVIRAATGA